MNTVATPVSMSEQGINLIKVHPITGKLLANVSKIFENVSKNNRDYHGAHHIATDGFKNFHASHIEIFNAGQPQVGRYPIHWHNADYVGEKDRLLTSVLVFNT